MSLTPRQQRFIEEYLVDLNGTQAAIRAGYSDRTANEQAARLLANVSIQAAVAVAKDARSARVQLTADEVLRELRRIILADPRKLLDEHGALRPVTEWDDDTAATVASLQSLDEYDGTGEDRQCRGVVRKLRLWDKVAAIALAAKHLGLLKDQPPGSADNPLVVKVIGAGASMEDL